MEDLLLQGLGDSHFHILEMIRKGLSPQTLWNQWFNSGLEYLLDVGVDMEDWDLRIKAALDTPRLWLASGYHPHNVELPGFEPSYAELKSHLHQEKTIALGEIGLDYFRGKHTAPQQKKLFEEQLNLARTENVPVILHNRDSDDDLLGILKEADLPQKGVFHCFSSGVETARKALDLGYYISFAGNLTYPSAIPLKESAVYVPQDRLLIETDSPYLAPVPVRGKPNSPQNLPHTLRYLSTLRSQDPKTLAVQMKTNFQTLFSLPKW